VEPVSRRASRIITATIRVPTTAEATRQPNGVIPKTSSPRAISHFPASGCTTMLGESVHSPVSRPARIFSLASET
jgi:hypothetical protein